MRSTRLLPLLFLLASGCSAPLVPTKSPAVLEKVDALAAFARAGWHLPFRVEVFLPEGDQGEDLALAQLSELERAYSDSPFDLYGAHVRVVPEGEAEASLEEDELLLEITLPLAGPPLSSRALLGRQAMPANDLARLVIYMAKHPRPNASKGYPGKRLRVVSLLDRSDTDQVEYLTGVAAEARLEESVDR